MTPPLVAHFFRKFLGSYTDVTKDEGVASKAQFQQWVQKRGFVSIEVMEKHIGGQFQKRPFLQNVTNALAHTCEETFVKVSIAKKKLDRNEKQQAILAEQLCKASIKEGVREMQIVYFFCVFRRPRRSAHYDDERYGHVLRLTHWRRCHVSNYRC